MTAEGRARPVLGRSDARAVARIVSGDLDPDRATLFSVFRDEMFFAPAFFAHYRALGIEQFLILDDGSVDGTREFLAAQPDCVLLGSDLQFGQEIGFVDQGRQTRLRAGTYLKMVLPSAYLGRGYVAYTDADEFLFLPPGADALADVTARLRARDAACCVASVVEFFPESSAALSAGPAPASFEDLLSAYGFFEPEPLVEIDAEGVPQARNRSKSTRLFERYGIRLRQRGVRRKLVGLVAPEYRKSPQFKTPIFRNDEDTYLTGSHVCNRPAPRDLLLTVAHFVFTSQFRDKVGRALDWRAHVNGADKYEYYEELLDRLAGGSGVLTDRTSMRFASVEQFVRAGLMRW